MTVLYSIVYSTKSSAIYDNRVNKIVRKESQTRIHQRLAGKEGADQGPKLSLQAARSRNTDAIGPTLARWHALRYCTCMYWYGISNFECAPGRRGLLPLDAFSFVFLFFLSFSFSS